MSAVSGRAGLRLVLEALSGEMLSLGNSTHSLCWSLFTKGSQEPSKLDIRGLRVPRKGTVKTVASSNIEMFKQILRRSAQILRRSSMFDFCPWPLTSLA